MLQDLQQRELDQLNHRDVAFARHNGVRIKDEWETKFLVGAKEHGGKGKPSLTERKGLIRDALQEHYDGISYTLAIEERMQKALAALRTIHKDRSIDSVTLDYVIEEVIELLQ
jgi:hypothetical protein